MEEQRVRCGKKIVANVLNIPVDIPENEQGPSMGGAMLAAVACGEYPTVRDAAEAIVKLTDTVEPEPELAAKYEERYQKFRKIYPACRGYCFWNLQNKIISSYLTKN